MVQIWGFGGSTFWILPPFGPAEAWTSDEEGKLLEIWQVLTKVVGTGLEMLVLR